MPTAVVGNNYLNVSRDNEKAESRNLKGEIPWVKQENWVRKFKDCAIALIMNGKESKTDKFMAVMNPSLGIQIAETPCCTTEEVELAVQSAKAAFPEWSSRPAAIRTQVLFKFRDLVNQHFDELATILATEMGKNLNEARGDVHKVVEACEVAVATPLEMQGHSAWKLHAITTRCCIVSRSVFSSASPPIISRR